MSVAAAYTDNEAVKRQIDELTPNHRFPKMVRSMFDNADRPVRKQSSLLRQRNDILLSIFKNSQEATQFDNGLYTIDCNANVNYLIPLLLPTELYSYSRKKECDQCGVEAVSNRCFVDIDMDQYDRQSIQNLNSCLLDTLLLEKSSKCSCNGTRKFTELKFSSFIVIDLHLKNSIKEIALQDIPETLAILDVKFSVTACLEYISAVNDDDCDVAKDCKVGHYVAHIYRRNNQWEKYDDTKSKITASKMNVKIQGQVLLYAKTDDPK